MSELDLRAENYQVGLENFHGFYAAWAKRNLFTRRRLILTTVVAVVLLVLTLWTVLQDQRRDFMIGLPPFEASLILGLIVAVSLVLYFLIAAFFIYGLSPFITYLQLLLAYWFGAARHLCSDAGLSDDGITKTTGGAVYLTTWSRIHDIVATRKTILIFTNRHCAMIIPKMAFASPEAADAFVTAAEWRWRAKTPNEPTAVF